MGFFDALTDLVSAATPWTEHQAEAVSGGSSDQKTPANASEGEGEVVVSWLCFLCLVLELRGLD